MKVKTELAIVFVTVLSVLALPSGAQAQGGPDAIQEHAWADEVPCKDEPDKRITVNSEILICLRYNEKELVPRSGGNLTDLVITSYTKLNKAQNLNPQIEQPVVYDPAIFPGLIIGVSSGRIERQGTRTSQAEYSYKLIIEDKIRPKDYHLILTTRQGAQSDKFAFKLPFWPGEGEWIEPSKESQKMVTCWSGRDCSSLKLFLKNNLPYELNIKEISVTSDPADLLEDHPLASHQGKLTVGDARQPLDLALKAKTVSFTRAFSGFKFPKATLIINYQDKFGRELSRNVDLDLEIKPNILLLIFTLVLGAIVGTVVRIDLRRLQKAGWITRRQKLIFAATTFVTGVVVCLIALFANLKFLVFEAQTPYSAWDPKILFVTGLVGTIGGIPILYSLLKLPNPPEVHEQSEEKQ